MIIVILIESHIFQCSIFNNFKKIMSYKKEYESSSQGELSPTRIRVRKGFVLEENARDGKEDAIGNTSRFKVSLTKEEVYHSCRQFISFIVPSLALMAVRAGYLVIIAIGLRIATETGTAEEVAGLGVCILLSSLITVPASFGPIEKMSLESARCFGANQYDEMKRVFFRGLCYLFFHFAIVYILMVLPSEYLLVWSNVDAEVASKTSIFLKWLFPTELIGHTRTYLISFSVSQNNTNGHGVFSFISLATAISVSLYTQYYMDIGFYSLYWTMYTFEITLFVQVAIYTYKTNTIGRFTTEHLTEGILENFLPHSRECLAFTFTMFIETIGTEISLYMCTQLHNNVEMAAYTIMNNIGFFTYHIGCGFSTVIRSHINQLIGQRKIEEAKRLFIVSTAGMVLVMSVIGLSVYLCRHTIVVIYSSSNTAIQDSLLEVLSRYSIFFILGYSMYSYTFSLARLLDMLYLLMALEVVVLIFIHATIDYILVFLVEVSSCVYIMYSLQSSLIFIHIVLIYNVYYYDWRDLYVEDEKEPRMQEMGEVIVS